MLSKKKKNINYLALVPVRNVSEFAENEGRITLLIPKFRNAWLRKWLIPKQKSANYNIRLDDVGSEVWRCINGSRNVEEISTLLKMYLDKNNKPSANVEERVTKFLSQLYKNNFIKFNEV